MLPVMLDTQRILAEKILGQFVDGGDHTLWFPFECRLPPATDPCIRRDLHQAHTGKGKNCSIFVIFIWRFLS